jgi:hypothetical protein
MTALLCLALDDRPLFLTDATRLLFQQLSGTSRRLLGVPGTAATERAFLAAYRRVRYCFGAICSVVDSSALPKNRRLAEQDLKARTRPMAPGQAEAARGRLEAVINALTEASISVLASEEHAAYDGCTGLDATPVPLFSRGPENPGSATRRCTPTRTAGSRAIIEGAGVKVRVITAEVTVTCHDGTTYGGSYRLATTLLDHRAWPATALIALYHERWVRHEALVRREALGIEGGARPPRRAVAAAGWELSAV